MEQYLQQLIESIDDVSLSNNIQALTIQQFVDGRHLSCPMPLLKTKVALRELHQDTDAVYTIATDPHSQNDIQAFCQKSGHRLWVNAGITNNNDTIFHFIITKNTY